MENCLKLLELRQLYFKIKLTAKLIQEYTQYLAIYKYNADKCSTIRYIILLLRVQMACLIIKMFILLRVDHVAFCLLY